MARRPARAHRRHAARWRPPDRRRQGGRHHRGPARAGLCRASACGLPRDRRRRSAPHLGSPVKTLRLRSYAKVNLGLEVLGTRSDGYHELRTIFQAISLHDDVDLAPDAGEIVVRCDHPGVPTDATNLAYRAAAELRRFAGVTKGVTITITKRI